MSVLRPLARPVRWLIVGLLAAGCGSTGPAGAPSIEFTTVPAAAEGGSGRLAPLAGRVHGARPGQKMVLFARSTVGVWWVQPLTVQPFTPIAADSTWRNTIHMGVEYAALLVEPSFRPPDTTAVLPAVGGAVAAVATVKGAGEFVPPPRRLITFSGYEWEVRQQPSDRGGANDYSAENATVDAEGALHLKLTQRDGRWTSAEVILTRALGYGTYQFLVRDAANLDPAAAVGLLTWDDQGADQNHRELDIEISQWGDTSVPNTQYVVQPYYVPANVARFATPAGRVLHSFRWEPGRAWFRSERDGDAARGRPPIAEHEFLSGVPTPGNERVRMNLYYFRYAPAPPSKEVELVIEKFHYLP
jgi:hypothetical protein